MRWYEYKMEVDDLHASDDLKAKLLALQVPYPVFFTVLQRVAAAIRFHGSLLKYCVFCISNRHAAPIS